MTREKYQELVGIVSEKSTLKPSPFFYDDYDDWRKKASLARFLTSFGLDYPQEAIELLRDVIAAPLDETSEDVDEDVDLRAWALRDLSVLECNQREEDIALSHIEQAIKLAESRHVGYSFTVRGELLLCKFDILRRLGREQEAASLAEAMLAEHEDSDALNDSYVFFGCQCKAKLAVAKENPSEVREFMLKALDGLDPSDETVIDSRANMESIDATHASAEDVFTKMLHCLPNAYRDIVWWDMAGTPPWKEDKSRKA